MNDYWDQLCAWMRLWHALFVLYSIVLVLVVSLVISPPDSAASVVNILNAAVLLPTTAGFLHMMVNRHDRNT